MAGEVQHAQLVAHYGHMVFGSDWVSPLARLAKVHPRTVQRIKEAASAGRDYPAARGVLAAMYEALQPILDELKPFVR